MNNFELKIVASEWDGAWFCDKCFSMHHYTEKAYVRFGKKYCVKCRKEFKK